MKRDPDPPAQRTPRTLDSVWHEEHDYLHMLASRSTVGAAPLDDRPDRAAAPVAGDPADRVTLDDQVQRALAIVLERLTPSERTAFVLHDIFGFPYAEIAEMVGRTATSCRQLASRARRTIRSARAPSELTDRSRVVGEHRRVVERFLVACNLGDVAGLLEVLDPVVAAETATADGQRLGHGDGADHVAAAAMRFIGSGSGTLLVPVFGEGGVDIVACYPDGRHGVVELDIADGVVHRVRITIVGSAVDGDQLGSVPG